MSGRLAGKVALISGTGRGMGRAAALVFAAEGAQVYGCDLNEAENAETVELVTKAGGVMDALAPVNLNNREGAQAWVAAAVERFGGVDVLYNNASALRNGPLMELTDDEWHFTIKNELDIVWYSVRAAWPHLVERGEARRPLRRPGPARLSQGRRPRDDQAPLRGGRRAPDPRERHSARSDLHTGDGTLHRRSRGSAAGHPAEDSARQVRQGRGGRHPGRLPGQRRRGVHHGSRDLHRRRRRSGGVLMKIAAYSRDGASRSAALSPTGHLHDLAADVRTLLERGGLEYLLDAGATALAAPPGPHVDDVRLLAPLRPASIRDSVS